MSTVRAPRRLPVARPKAEPRALPKPDLTVVPAARPRRAGAAAITALAVFVVFVALFTLAVFNTWLVQNQQRLDRLHTDVTEAQSDYQKLRLTVAQLESPEHIVDVAVNQLGMVPPPETTYLTPSAPLDAPAIPAGATGAAETNDLAAADDDWATVKPYLDATP